MPSLTLASFNTHWSGLTPQWEQYDVVKACRELEADVLVLEEVWWPDGGTSFVDELAADGYTVFQNKLMRGTRQQNRPTLGVEPTNGIWGFAVLSRFPMDNPRRLDLGTVPTDPITTRSALQVTVHVDETPLEVVGVHLSRALVFPGPIMNLRKLKPQLPAPGTPTVITGDFNFWGPPVVALLPSWKRAVRGYTWPTQFPFNQIDHMLIRPNDVRAKEARVGPPAGSDHRSIRAVLEWDK